MDKTYTIIPDFMLDYDLNMTEIVALAVIYGFCQDGKSDFHGSYNYLARKCKIERRSAMRIVGRLEQKGYVTRTLSEVGGVKFCSISTTFKGSDRKSPVVTESHRGGDIVSSGVVTESHPIINRDNKEIIKRGSAFAPPTRDQVREFFRERKFNSDPDAFWLHFENCNWKLSSGRGAKMKDWRLAAISWEKRENQFKR